MKITSSIRSVRAFAADFAEDDKIILVVSRTPLRVSFFGGGTDYPQYFRRGRGCVIGMAISRYVHIAAVHVPLVIDYRYRISYSRIETVNDALDIRHPVVRGVLRHLEWSEPLNLSIMMDLPPRSGLGSSSSFAVGLINLIHALKGKAITRLDLARTAVFVEHDLLAENVGVQDQYHAAFGGLNRFEFTAGRTRIEPLDMVPCCQAALTDSLFLIYTGVTRLASQTLEEQMRRTAEHSVDRELSHLLALVDQAGNVLAGEDPMRLLQDFGDMLHEGWETKKKLSSMVSNPQIDDLYESARSAGALAGKLCGAGGGGFLLMLVPPNRQRLFRERMINAHVIKVGIDTIGSTILAG